MKNYSGTAQTVIVQDAYTGGVFVHQSTGPSDNIIIFTATVLGGFWKRQFNQSDGINVLWGGAKGDGGQALATITGTNKITFLSGTPFSSAIAGQTIGISNAYYNAPVPPPPIPPYATFDSIVTTIGSISGSTITLATGSNTMQAIPAPTGVNAVLGASTGGILPANVYDYYVLAIAYYSNSAASAYSISASVTNTGTTSFNNISWTAVPEATAYAVYRIVHGSPTTNVDYYLVPQDVTSITPTTSFIDTGAPFDAYSSVLPTFNVVKVAFGTDDTSNLVPIFNLPYNIFFPSGHTFITTNELTNQSLSGYSNRKISAYGAIIVRMYSDYQFIVFDKVNDVTIEGGVWTTPFATKGPDQNEHCFEFDNSTDINILNTHINGSPQMGVCFTSVTNSNVTGNVIENCFRDGIYAGYCCNVKITDNLLRNIQDDAISLHDYGNPNAKENFPLGIPQAGSSIISGNIVNNALQGFCSISGAYISVLNNQISNTLASAVSFYNVPSHYSDDETYNMWVNHIDIEGNICTNNCATVFILGKVFKNNNQPGHGGAAIAVNSEGPDNTINTVGIDIRSNNISIQNNKIYSSACNAVLAHQIDGLTISNNYAFDSNVALSSHTGNTFTIINCTQASIIGNQAIANDDSIQQKKCYTVQNTSGYMDFWFANAWTDSTPGEIVGSELINVYTPDNFKKQVKVATTTNISCQVLSR